MARERYERPTIIRHVSGLANKFGRAQARQTMPSIDGVPVAQLAAEHGSPLFVFSEATLRRAYREAYRAFSVRYPRVRFAWSYKTNYLDAVCAVFHDEGAWAEVVSEHEYEMARRRGVPGDRILFNGPYKPREALERAVAEGARIHVDHHDELYEIEGIAKEKKTVLDVTLRCNMDTGIYPSWDRFGFNLDNGEARDAVRRMHLGGALRLGGLHAHIGTFILEPSAYKAAAAKLAALARDVGQETGWWVEYIDVGGGFPSRNTLHAQYAPGDESNPSLDAYAEAITSAMLGAGFPPDRTPLLVLETGRALVDEAGYLVASVVANKRLPNGLRSMDIDAGVNILFTAFWYRHEVVPADDRGGMLEETIIYGPLCMNIDVVRPSIRLPPMEVGDRLVIRPVGAYNVTQWLQFIRMRPRVVMIGGKGQVAVIREREDVGTIKQLERMPPWIK